MEEIKFCPHCSHPNKGDNRYCENCGKELDNSSFSIDSNQTQTIDTSLPEVEKDNIVNLNYSQTLRRALFINPIPFFSSFIFLLFILGDVVLTYFLNDRTISYSTIWGFVFLGIDLLYLANCLIISPLRSMNFTKKCAVSFYKVGFFKDRIHYQLTLSIQGRDMRSDFILPYKDIIKVKNYKDMMILAFFVQGQVVPFILLKDDKFEKIYSLMKNKIEELSKKKK